MVALGTKTRRKPHRSPSLRRRVQRAECRSDPETKPPSRVHVRSSGDIVQARQYARELAMQMGFPGSDVTRITSAISEIARNILDYAREGVIEFRDVEKGRGMLITARDHGPGIPDVSLAMQYGYSSGNGLGVGLPGARWLMDEFNIESRPGQGTVVTMKKWLG